MSEYLEFREQPRRADRKTPIFDVVSKMDGTVLGHVQFWGAWRKFVFVPIPNTLYDAGCLTELADYCGRVTSAWRTNLAVNRK